MYSTMGWATIPPTVIAMLLLGIEEIGIEIEEPFGILPLIAIATRARQDCTELINKQHLVKESILDREDATMMSDVMFNIVPKPSLQANGNRVTEHAN
jgi:predicted membrane chloride channel (bestrophin family)